jgi:hypothetical protein
MPRRAEAGEKKKNKGVRRVWGCIAHWRIYIIPFRLCVSACPSVEHAREKKKDTVQIRENKTGQEGEPTDRRTQTLCVSFFLSLLFLVFYIRTSRQSIIAQSPFELNTVEKEEDAISSL